MELSSFSAKGKINHIGEVKKFSNITYLEVKIEMQFSKQILDFYITESENTPTAFQLIRKNFGQYQSYQLDEEIQFDFNIVKNSKQETKLKIWKIYNKGFKNGMESKN